MISHRCTFVETATVLNHIKTNSEKNLFHLSPSKREDIHVSFVIVFVALLTRFLTGKKFWLDQVLKTESWLMILHA